MKMDKEILTFSDIEVEKNNVCNNNTPIFFQRCRYWVDFFWQKAINTLLVTCIMIIKLAITHNTS